MTESKKKIATALLESIDAGTSKHVRQQLAGLSFTQLQLLLELFGCSINDLTEKVWAHKRGKSKQRKFKKEKKNVGQNNSL